MLKLKEMKTQREEELEGGWYTEERMLQDLGYSRILSCILVNDLLCPFHVILTAVQTQPVAFRNLVTKVKAYCQRFKSVLVRTGFRTSVCSQW